MIKLQYNLRRKVLLVTILIFAISVNFMLFSSLLNQSNSSNKVQEKNFEFYNLKVSGQEINITSPENKTYTTPMNGYYPATYGFENDVIGSDPIEWSVYEVGGTVNVITSLGNHNKIVEVHNNAPDHTRLTNTFSATATGTIESWVRTNTIIDESIVLRAVDGPSTDELLISVNSATNKWEYNDGGTWYDMTADVAANTWYHFKIEFDCADDWHVWIDGVSQDGGTGFGYRGSPTQMDRFIMGTTQTATECYAYFDAIGYSWDPNYNIGDNLYEGLLLSYENNTNLVWKGYSLDGQANKTILGNTTILFLSEGIHTIQMFGNNTFGSIFQSDIRYFTTLYYPVMTINSPNPNEFFGSTAPNYDISIIESNLHSRWYNLNNGVNITISGLTGTLNQTEWDIMVNGSVTIRFFANDTWGLEGYNEVTVWKDIYTPTSSIIFIPHSGIDIVNESTEFSFTADDGLGSGISFIRYRVNDSSWVTYTTPFILANYPYGDTLISYQAVDQVDNFETIQMLTVHRTDTIAPTSLISFTPYKDPDVVIKSTTFSITATDDQFGSGISLIRFKINNSIWFDYLGPINLSNYDYGEYIITYQAIDEVGNIEVEHGITVILTPEPSEPGIPGYHLFITICIIGIVSALIIRKKLKSII